VYSLSDITIRQSKTPGRAKTKGEVVEVDAFTNRY